MADRHEWARNAESVVALCIWLEIAIRQLGLFAPSIALSSHVSCCRGAVRAVQCSLIGAGDWRHSSVSR